MRQIRQEVFTTGSVVRMVVGTDGILSGELGVVLGRYSDDDSVVVSFAVGARRIPSSYLVTAAAPASASESLTAA